MNITILPFLLSLALSHRLYKFSKINQLNQWVKPLNYARYFTGFLFVVEIMLSASETTRWFWHLFMGGLLLFALQQKEMRSLRMYLLAFAPYVVIAFISDLTEIVLNDFYTRWENYFKNAGLLSVIWLIAILFSQHRQYKAAEKERIQRLQEEKINKAIAARKVELEGLVEERTAELLKQKEELEQTLHELKATQKQLIQSEKMASLGELTAGIAHEIQNPLNFVNNFSEVNKDLLVELKEEIENGNHEEVLALANDLIANEEKILHHGKRAESIVKGMLLHSRGSSGVKEPTDINDLADEYLRLAFHGLRAKDKTFNAKIKTNFDKNLDKINVVPQDLGRVILNLVTNAFYSVSEKRKKQIENYEPEVLLSTVKKGNKIYISVKDNGNGIPDSIADKIFQPFFTTKPSGQGTGLGLSMSYEIITKTHNGELILQNNSNEGATFTIILPILKTTI